MNIFIITSAVVSHCPNSKFTTEMRCAQTVESTRSIRKYVPNSFIVLIDASESKHLSNELQTSVDLYINAHDFPAVNQCVSAHKSMGEFSLVYHALECIKQLLKTRISECHRIFKLSGRYYLTPEFDVNHYATDKYNFKREADRGVVHTTLYSFDPSKLDEYQQILNQGADALRGVGGMNDIEHLLYARLPHNATNWLERLNVEGLVANGDTYTA